MPDSDPSVPVSPGDVIAEALGVFDDASPVSPEECADTALAALARAGFVVVPSTPSDEEIDTCVRAVTGQPYVAAVIAQDVRRCLDAFLAPYRPTED